MSLSRRIKRKQVKAAKKAAKKSAKNIDKIISKMPQKCSRCNTYFDKSLSENLDKWHIDLAANTFTLCCPDCYVKENQ